MKFINKIYIVLLMLGCCLCASAQTDSAQSENEKKAAAIEILTCSDYFSYHIKKEWEGKNLDYAKLTKRAKQKLLEEQINPERKKKGLPTRFGLDRWDPVIKTIIYRDRGIDYIIAYVTVRDVRTFGMDTDIDVPIGGSTDRPAGGRTENPAGGSTVRRPQGQFNLPENVRLDVPPGLMEILVDLYKNPAMTTSEAEDKLFNLFSDGAITNAEQVESSEQVQSNCVLYEILGNSIGRIIGYANNGNFYDIRTGEIVSRGIFDSSVWMVITYDHSAAK